MSLAGAERDARPRVLLLEPYFTGSHRSWALGYQDASACDVRLLTLPGRFWKWRMHGGALTLARQWNAESDPWRPDVIIASDMLDLTTFLAMTRRTLGNVPAAVYAHENQLAYPPQRPRSEWSDSRRKRSLKDAADAHYAFINAASFAAADHVLWNSEHNRSSFLQRLPEFLNSFPDHREPGLVADIKSSSQVLPLGIDLASLDAARPIERHSGPRPPLIVWNHRWEYDKGPDVFFSALQSVSDQGGDFRVVLLGERFATVPDVFDDARMWLGERIVHHGYVESRAEYAEWLWLADLVVSTAQHEFFGASVCEALYCGCAALLPNRLAYPELIPEGRQGEVLYDSDEELVDRLIAICSESAVSGPPNAHPQLRHAAARFDWSVMAPEYDAFITTVAGTSTRAISWN